MGYTIDDVKMVYLPKLVGTTADNAVLEKIKTMVDSCAINYLDKEDITSEADLPDALCWKLMKQVAHEYQLRRSVGITSVTSPDGSVTRMEIEEWLPDVRKALIRFRALRF